jgi:hypothetical protein
VSGRASLRAVVFLAVAAACEPSGQAPQPQVYPRWWQEFPTPTPAPTTTPGPAVSPTPEPPRCNVAVLEQEPAEDFELVGVVEVASRGVAANPESALEAARLQACALGGDALVLLYKRERRRSGQGGAPPPQGVLPDPELRAAVIRYRVR